MLQKHENGAAPAGGFQRTSALTAAILCFISLPIYGSRYMFECRIAREIPAEEMLSSPSLVATKISSASASSSFCSVSCLSCPRFRNNRPPRALISASIETTTRVMPRCLLYADRSPLPAIGLALLLALNPIPGPANANSYARWASVSWFSIADRKATNSSKSGRSSTSSTTSRPGCLRLGKEGQATRDKPRQPQRRKAFHLTP